MYHSSMVYTINNSLPPISNSWRMKARQHVIITFTVFLMNINQTLLVARAMLPADGMISIEGLN